MLNKHRQILTSAAVNPSRITCDSLGTISCPVVLRWDHWRSPGGQFWLFPTMLPWSTWQCTTAFDQKTAKNGLYGNKGIPPFVEGTHQKEVRILRREGFHWVLGATTSVDKQRKPWFSFNATTERLICQWNARFSFHCQPQVFSGKELSKILQSLSPSKRQSAHIPYFSPGSRPHFLSIPFPGFLCLSGQCMHHILIRETKQDFDAQ